MELINIEQLMRDKLDECNAWLGGKDEAVSRLDEAEKAYESARLAYEQAKNDVADYNDENIVDVEKYKSDLEHRLGIVVEQPEVVDVVDEAVAEPVAQEETPIVGIIG